MSASKRFPKRRQFGLEARMLHAGHVPDPYGVKWGMLYSGDSDGTQLGSA